MLSSSVTSVCSEGRHSLLPLFFSMKTYYSFVILSLVFACKAQLFFPPSVAFVNADRVAMTAAASGSPSSTIVSIHLISSGSHFSIVFFWNTSCLWRSRFFASTFRFFPYSSIASLRRQFSKDCVLSRVYPSFYSYEGITSIDCC